MALHVHTKLFTRRLCGFPQPERTELLRQLEELQRQRAALAEELAKYAENDPELLSALGLHSQIPHTSTNMLTAHCSLTSRVCVSGRDTKRAMEGANRWTDNVYAIRKHCENQFGMSGSEFDQAFQVPADFDYME